jgi:hypothetical protein
VSGLPASGPVVSEALETLRLCWGDAYGIGSTAGRGWTAVSLDAERREFTAGTAGELEAALRADWAREGTL